MKILLVEDEREQQEAFKEAIHVLEHRDGLNVEYKIVKDVSGAITAIDGSYDGAIIDLKLGDNEIGGNEVVRQLWDQFARIPTVFVTAFVDFVDNCPSVINKRSREDGTYESDLLLFLQIYDTGLTRIMGGRGEIEKYLSEVFHTNLLPQIQTWVPYGKKEPERTERALLRYTLNHLFQLLEEGEDRCFPEEVYLHPSMSDNITTGSIVKEKTTNESFVVLSPACDLVIRKNGEFKTDRLLLVEIECANGILDEATTDIKKMAEGRRKREKLDDKLRDVLNNNYSLYYHWLPPAYCFNGGFLNFRKVNALTKDEFDDKFENPSIQISPFFVKDIVARFSCFYARQGQPDIDSSDFVARYTASQ